ncbi:MAG: ABC transporter substrate-binding protein [Planctomycetes bacterium]|nr:ABC transporter substrate-binding protein [Planctomycetota bacterium]
MRRIDRGRSGSALFRTAITPLFACILAVLAAVPAPAVAVELTMYCNPSQLDALRSVIADWEETTGNSVRLLTAHDSSSEVLPLYRKLLEDGNQDIDIYNVDQAWTAMVAPNLVDLRAYMAGLEKLHLPGVIDNYTIGGRLVAMPQFVDAGVMFYRKDLLDKYNLPLPFTWSRLVDCANTVVAAERASGDADIWGLVFQGARYEGLTCCALEWIYAHGGGTIVDEDGAVTINNPDAVAALRMAADWIGTLCPPDVLDMNEEASRKFFQGGRAVFLRNWPYVWPYLQAGDSPVRGRVGVMPVPKGTPNGPSPGVSGGWALAVSKHSRYRETAADLVFYLTGPLGQKKFCLTDNHIPSVTSLFFDPKIRRAIPMAVQEFFTATVARPVRQTGGKYDRVTTAFYETVHDILSKQVAPEDGVKTLETELTRLGQDGWN